MNNMIPFFDELARVTAPGGQVAVSYSRGASTPIWVPLERVQAELERRNFSHVAISRRVPASVCLPGSAIGRRVSGTETFATR